MRRSAARQGRLRTVRLTELPPLPDGSVSLDGATPVVSVWCATRELPCAGAVRVDADVHDAMLASARDASTAVNMHDVALRQVTLVRQHQGPRRCNQAAYPAR